VQLSEDNRMFTNLRNEGSVFVLGDHDLEMRDSVLIEVIVISVLCFVGSRFSELVCSVAACACPARQVVTVPKTIFFIGVCPVPKTDQERKKALNDWEGKVACCCCCSAVVVALLTRVSFDGCSIRSIRRCQ
jgi:hypothetical protein